LFVAARDGEFTIVCTKLCFVFVNVGSQNQSYHVYPRYLKVWHVFMSQGTSCAPDKQETMMESLAGKCKPGEDMKEAKKLCWLKQKKQCQQNWKENKKFDPMLKATKQKIMSTHSGSNMGALFRVHGLRILDALKKIGIPLTTCGHFSLWGGCGDPTCTLKHDNTKLMPMQVSIANEIFNHGALKLKKPKHD